MKRQYHFVGIGGVGMGTLASLVLDRGHSVSGSDSKENAMTQALRAKGASIFIGHDAGQVGSADFVIYSSAIRADNPELAEAGRRGIPTLKRAKLLSELMENQCGITVVGAHGKTTTSSMTANLLLKAGFNPTTAIGGVINGETYHANLGDGKYFVAELDESDGSFLYFKPRISVLTNIDFEHVDYYHTWENILAAFKQFIGQTDSEGTVIAFGGDDRLMTLVRGCGRTFMTYGLNGTEDVFARNIREENGADSVTAFDCYCGTAAKLLGEIRLRVPGRHNILNAMACVAVGLNLGIDFAVIQESLKSFQGVKRRFQWKGRMHGIAVVDDYGHHPTEVEATLKTALSLRDKRLITVFQPHRYTRTKFLMADFVRVLALSDQLIITDIYAASEKPIPGVSAEALCERIVASGKKEVRYLPKEKIFSCLKDMVQPGDMVLTLGAGDVYRAGEELVEFLQKQSDGASHLTGVVR